MITLVGKWTGAEVRALRLARRMSLVEFAAHLGVADRLVSKWEAGQDRVTPRPVNQAALDTSLARLTSDERLRFTELVTPGTVTDTRETDVPLHAKPTRHPVDGKLMTWIPEGTYLAGLQDDPAWLAGFWIDIFPTTNADFARFVAATGHPVPQHWVEGKPPAGSGDHPVVWVSWDDAAAYARWAGKELPTAAQWEKTARGTRGNVWPWGNQTTPAKANCRGSGPGTTTPVDRYASGTSPWGVYDLCGNVWEWLSTESEPGRFELKGSAFTSPFDRAVPAAFNDAAHSMLDDDTGFRCVVSELPR
ncbi:SUMF1/EgtB/PvdO family nonheme iron enzyme [Nocardia thailandica]